MTGRTHDLAALTTLTILVATQPLTPITIGTLFTAIAANMIGGVAPDIDQPTSKIWKQIPAGSIIGKVVRPFFGAHRSISHSLIGVLIFGFISREILRYVNTFLLVDMDIVWITFMLGLLSHLIADSLTKDGVPWLFPIPIRFGFPPFRGLRITTGKLLESSFVFPSLLLINAFIIYTNYEKFWDFLKNYIVR